MLLAHGPVPYGSVLHAEPTAPTLSQSSPPQPVGAPIVFSGAILFAVYDKVGSFGPQERATAITVRLSSLAKDRLFSPDTIAVVEEERTSEIVAGDLVILGVTDGDAGPTGRARQQVAQDYAIAIRHVLTTSLEQTSLQMILIDGAYALLITVIFIAFLIAFHIGFPKLYEKILGWRGTDIPPLKIQRVKLLSANQIALGVTALARGLRVVEPWPLAMCG